MLIPYPFKFYSYINHFSSGTGHCSICWHCSYVDYYSNQCMGNEKGTREAIGNDENQRQVNLDCIDM